MADDADLAQHISEQIIELQTKNRVVTRMEFTGFCYNCEEPVKMAALFCDKDCRDDYEHRERMSLQNGRNT
jgi:hypothetical protein